jgi:hypothetical protein
VLFSLGVAATLAVDDRNAPEHHVAAVLPISPAVEGTITQLRLVTPAGTAIRLSTQPGAPGVALVMRDPGAEADRPSAVTAGLRWDGATYPMALIRDAGSGQILSFARGGQAVVWTQAAALDVTFSDGTRSVAARLRP